MAQKRTMSTLSCVSVGGDQIVKPLWVEPSEKLVDLSKRAATVLEVPRCTLVSKAGIELSLSTAVEETGLEDGDVITAVGCPFEA